MPMLRSQGVSAPSQVICRFKIWTANSEGSSHRLVRLFSHGKTSQSPRLDFSPTESNIFISGWSKSMSLTGLIVKGFVSSELGEHLPLRNLQWIRPAGLSAPKDTNPYCAAVWSLYKDRQRLGMLVPRASTRSTSVSILQLNIKECSATVWIIDSKWASHASGGNQLLTRLPPLPPLLLKKQGIQIIVRLYKLHPNNCTSATGQKVSRSFDGSITQLQLQFEAFPPT